MIKRVSNVLLPKGSWRRKIAKKTLIVLHLKSPVVAGYYNTLMQQQKSHPSFSELRDVSRGPLISVVVPAFNTPQRYLDDLVYSIISQSYENWELILVNASTDDESKARINACAKKDNRIKIVKTKNGGISSNTNVGIASSTGEYIAFCDHDDVLEPFALYEVAASIRYRRAELIYTDEDKVSDDGEIYFDPHYKPDWSPDLLTHVNYINHLTVMKKSLIEKAGMLNKKRDGAQDYDLLLRVTDLNPVIDHIPKVLYHWRAARNSTAQDFSSKKHITDAAKASLEEHFLRKGLQVRAVPKPQQPGFYELIFDAPKTVTVIITPFASSAAVKLFVELLFKKLTSKRVKVELIVPDTFTISQKSDSVSVVQIDAGSEYLRRATDIATYKTSIIFNKVALPTSKDWIERLTGVLVQKHVRAVSPLLIHDGSVIDDCGLVRDGNDNLIALFKDTAAYGNQTYFGNTSWVRNVDALSGGVVAVRTKDLRDYFRDNNATMSNEILRFSLSSGKKPAYNTIYTEVVLDTLSIKVSPHAVRTTHFNENLTNLGSDYIPYTPESAIVNILLGAVDQTGIKI